MSARSHLSTVMFLVMILLGFTSQVVFVKSAVPPFSDPRNDLLDGNGKSVTAEPNLDIVMVDYRRSGSDYIFELTLNGALPDRADPSFWIDWGIMINSDKDYSTGWRGFLLNDLGADLFIRLGMGKSGIVPQTCELTPSFRIVDKPGCNVEGSRITFTVTSSIGSLIDSGCAWIAVARKYDESGRIMAWDTAPNGGYYITPATTVQTTATGILTETTRAEITFTQKTISTYPPVNWTSLDNVNNIDWNSASRVVAGGLTWESISTKYFMLCYNTSRDKPIVEAVARVDNLYTFMKAYSGVDVKTPIRIWLCSSREAVERIVEHVQGRRAYYTAAGDLDRGHIFVDLSNTERGNWTGVWTLYGAYLGILLHELAHFFIWQKSSLNYYSWGNEILCTYFHWKVYAYYGSNRYLQPLATVTKLQLTTPFTKIVDEGLLKQYPELFNVGASVLFYLSDVWGDDGVKLFWSSLAYSAWKEPLEKTFGQSVDDLEKQWKTYYEESWPNRAASEVNDAQQKFSRWRLTERPADRISQNATLEMQKAEYNKRIWNFGTAYVCAVKAISILDSGFRQAASECVDLARVEIERARLEKRTVGLEQAEADLQRSQQLFQQGAYEQAYILASRATSTAKSTKVPAMVAMTSDTNTYIILLIAATVIVVVLLIWKRSKKTSK